LTFKRGTQQPSGEFGLSTPTDDCSHQAANRFTKHEGPAAGYQQLYVAAPSNSHFTADFKQIARVHMIECMLLNTKLRLRPIPNANLIFNTFKASAEVKAGTGLNECTADSKGLHLS